MRPRRVALELMNCQARAAHPLKPGSSSAEVGMQRCDTAWAAGHELRVLNTSRSTWGARAQLGSRSGAGGMQRCDTAWAARHELRALDMSCSIWGARAQLGSRSDAGGMQRCDTAWAARHELRASIRRARFGAHALSPAVVRTRVVRRDATPRGRLGMSCVSSTRHAWPWRERWNGTPRGMDSGLSCGAKHLG